MADCDSFAQGVVPWAISTLLPRYGWEARAPGWWNQLGVIPITRGCRLVWLLVMGIAHNPDTVTLGLTLSILLTCGSYRFTRNPMYIAELGLWLGWVFFGTPAILARCVAFRS